ncbi:SH3 domain-containing protein [Paeniglutamicibacter sp. NPDC012692]|uniref:SH3 domain-containing protein n=1 Tax=Paeniglutamicibacter sp. NPDC012692 TaxID=3364388 RepID=UPI0036A7843F
MTSPMGPRCIPVIGGSTFHLGQDMGADDNEPIYAIATGKVRSIVKGTSTKSGIIVVEHQIDGARYEFAYMHMWPNDVMVEVGDVVKAGEQIARVGDSGPATGPHLHLEIWKDRFYSSDANVLNPVTFLKNRGVDLKANAAANYAGYNKSCTYYARGKTEVFASASTSSKVLGRPGRNTEVTSKPGAINGLLNGDFVKVQYGSLAGWMNRFAVSPGKLAEAPAGSLTTAGTVTNGVKIPFATYRNPDVLNMRSGAASWYSRITTLPAGSTLKAYESASGWTRVKYGSNEGWVSSALISKIADIDPSTVATTHQVTRDLKLRSGAGYSYAETQSLKRGTQVSIRRTVGTWSQIQAGKVSGWLRTADLMKAGSTAQPPTQKPPAVTSLKKKSYTTKAKVTIRKSPDSKSASVRSVAAKKKVTVNAKSGSWLRVSYAGKTGWVPAKQLAVYKAPVKTKTTKTGLNLRKSASTSSKSILVIPKGKKVTFKAAKGSWSQVRYAGKTGWVKKKYLK